MKHLKLNLLLILVALTTIISVSASIGITNAAVSSLGWVGDMSPAGGSTTNASSVIVSVKVYKANVTQGAGQGAGITCQLHWGVSGSAWQDLSMTYAGDVDGMNAGDKANDKYQATLAPSAPGTYGFKAYCTDDGGTNKLWVVGSTDGILVSGSGGTPTTPATPSTPVTVDPNITPTPNTWANRTAYVNLFEWSWDSIAKECVNYLGPKGYKAVQVSPPMEHIQGEPWWTRYQPVSYQIVSRSGNRQQFQNMVNTCKAAGVDIYVDTVINHMAAGGSGATGNAGSNYSNRNFPGVPFSANDFHNPECLIRRADYDNNRSNVINCELSNLDDLNTGSQYVQEKIAAYMRDLLSLGVAGFRIDAAKHMHDNDLRGILDKVPGTYFVTQEIIPDAVTPQLDYYKNGTINEFDYMYIYKNAFLHLDNQSISGINTILGPNNPWNLLPSDKATVFVSNHDTERKVPENQTRIDSLNVYDGPNYLLSNVIMLAMPYGYPQIMSGYYFRVNGDLLSNASHDQGPAGAAPYIGNETIPANCSSNINDTGKWDCMHRSPYVGNMVGFRNITNGAPVTNWQAEGNDRISFQRQGKGFVAVNHTGNSWSISFATGLPAGQYCNVVKGELSNNGTACTGAVITVDASGNANATVAAEDAIAIHIGQRIGVITPVPTTIVPPTTAVPTTPVPTTPAPVGTPDILLPINNASYNVGSVFTAAVQSTGSSLNFYVDNNLVGTDSICSSTAPTDTVLTSSSLLAVDSITAGAPGTITIDGLATGWTQANLIATDPAYDNAQAVNAVHHERQVDFSALYAAWDSTNLYIGLQGNDVVDVWDPANANSGAFPSTWQADMFLAIDTEAGGYTGGGAGGNMFGKPIYFGTTAPNKPDYEVWFRMDMYGGLKLLKFNGAWVAANATVVGAGKALSGPGTDVGGQIIGGARATGTYNANANFNYRTQSANGVQHDAAGRSTLWELKIPLASIGNPDLNSRAVYVMAYNGFSAIDSIPNDPQTTNLVGVSDSNSPLEWQDFLGSSLPAANSAPDTFTAPFACIGTGCSAVPPTAVPTSVVTPAIPTPVPNACQYFDQTINTASLSIGTHTLKVVDNNGALATRTFTVAQICPTLTPPNPSVSVSQPPANSIVSGNFTATALTNVIRGTKFYIDDLLVGNGNIEAVPTPLPTVAGTCTTPNYYATYTLPIDISALSDGQHTLRVQGTSIMGGVVDSTPVTFTVQRNLPSGNQLQLSPATGNVAVGNTFTVDLQIKATGQTINGAEFHLNFNPALLEVVQLQPVLTSLPLVLTPPVFDNAAGTLDITTGATTNWPTGTFTTATVTFRAKAAGTAALTLATTSPRLSRATSSDGPIITTVVGASFVLTGENLGSRLLLSPATANTVIGNTFVVDLKVNAGSAQVDGASFFVNFDPTKFEVVKVTSDSSKFGTVLTNQYNNVAGTLDYTAGTMNNFPTGEFSIASVVMRAKVVGDNLPLTLNTSGTRISVATFSSQAVITATSNSSISVANANMTLTGVQSLQGRPAGAHASRIIPVIIEVLPVGGTTPVATINTSIDSNSTFNAGVNLAPGTYDVRIKGTHTLRAKIASQALNNGANTLNFSVLLEGDVNNDNQITLFDWSAMVANYSKCVPIADANANLNEQGCVDLNDVTLLIANFGQSTLAVATDGHATGAQTASMNVMLDKATVTKNDTFTATVWVDSTNATTTASQIGLRYDANLFDVLAVNAGETLGEVLLNNNDTPGELRFASASFNGVTGRKFELVQVVFRAKTDAATSVIPLSDSGASFGGQTIAAAPSVTQADGSGAIKLFMPFLTR